MLQNPFLYMAIFFFSFFFLEHTNAQSHQRFRAGIVTGLNFAELEGDGITDYFGLNAGVLGTAKLSKNWQFGMELLFSQNGEYILPDYYPQIRYGTIWLNHIEIPAHFDLLMRVFKKGKYADWQLQWGVAYVKLLSYHAEDAFGLEVSDQFIYEDETSFNLQAGTTYFFSENIGLNLKASLPMLQEGLDWTLAARLVYMI